MFYWYDEGPLFLTYLSFYCLCIWLTVRKFKCFLLHYWVKFNHLTNACGGGGGSLVARSCLTLGISQARRLKWVAISFARGSSQPRDRTHVSCLASRFFTPEPPGKPQQMFTTHLFCATHLLKIHNWNKTDKWSTFIKFIIWEGVDHEYTERQTM